MNRTLFFLAQDLKLTWRENSNRIFLLLPPVFFILLQTAVPAILEAYPAVAEYGVLLLSGFVLQGSILFGFVGSFMLLDEKDQGLFPVFQVAPVSMNQLLLMKVTTPFLITFVYAICALAFNPVHVFSGLPLVATALAFSLVTPLAALLIAGFGRNKVEGLTYFKAIDMVLLTPALSFFLPGMWKYVFAVVPTYWAFKGADLVARNGMGSFYLHISVAIAFQLGLVAVGIWLFKKRL